MGPFNVDELKAKKITKTTQVWCEGLDDWRNAEEVEDLKSIFTVMPPPIKQLVTIPPFRKDLIEVKGRKKRSWGKIIISLIVTAFLIVVALGFITNYSNDSGTPPSYEESLMTIAEIESFGPIDYLNADGTYNKTVLGDQIKINGQINNKATVTTYKDVVIEVVFYSKTNSEVGRENYTIYDFFEPNSKKDFTLQVKNYSNVETIGWEVASALVK